MYVLVETSGSSAEHDGEKLGGFLEGVMEAGLVLGEPPRCAALRCAVLCCAML
jgi:hypothetical protein